MDKAIKVQTDAFLEEVLLTLRLERAIIFVKVDGCWQVSSAHEIDVRDFWNSAPLSLAIIHAAAQGKRVHLMDAWDSNQFGKRTSVILTGVRSVACMPYKTPSGEVVVILYADNRLSKGAFSEDDVSILEKLATDMGRRLFEK